MLRQYKAVSIIIILFAATLEVQGQKADNQLWVDYNLNVPVTKKFSYGGDVGLRGFLSNKDWNQIILRPTLGYRFNKTIKLGAGLGGFFMFNEGPPNSQEFRLQEEVNISWPELPILTIYNRLRFDQQFFNSSQFTNERSGRARYLVGIRSKDLYPIGIENPFYLEIFWEGFKTLGQLSVDDTFVDRDRWTAVFGHRIKSLFRYEVHYINQRRFQSEFGFTTTQHILRLRFFQRVEAKERNNLP